MSGVARVCTTVPILALALAVSSACGDNRAARPPHDSGAGGSVDAASPDAGDAGSPAGVMLQRAFRGPDLPGCALASPVLVEAGGEKLAIVVTSEGRVAAFAHDGTLRWSFDVPAPAGQTAEIAATPAVIGHLVVIAWQDRAATSTTRYSHHVAVVDAETGAFDPGFPDVTLAASVPGNGGTVTFDASHEYSRATIVAGRRAGDNFGFAYVGFGNLQDVQPWHGWLFELDLDAWRNGGAAAAISSVLLTTPEATCGSSSATGGCGGAIWAPAGEYLLQKADTFEIWVPTGNGQLDLGRHNYANSILRLGPGLAFDPHCDPTACASFDPDDPAEACMASCQDEFIPRLRAGDPPLQPQNGRCDGKTFLQCYAELDLDLGADTPAPVTLPSGRQAVVLPAKDGAVYLFDEAHMGTMLDRLQVRAFCGDNGGNCDGNNWAGTMVTDPLITYVGGQPVALVPTFYYDHTNPGGVVALDIDEDGSNVTLHERWSAPPRDSTEAVAQFREHTGRLALLQDGGDQYVVIADPADSDAMNAVLYLIRVDDGAIVARDALDGPGQRYQKPAVDGQRFFINSCKNAYATPAGPSHLEGWDLVDPSP